MKVIEALKKREDLKRKADDMLALVRDGYRRGVMIAAEQERQGVWKYSLGVPTCAESH
jgi:hypothetical protein